MNIVFGFDFMLLRVFPDFSFYLLTGNTVVVEDPKVFESGKTIE